MSTKSVAIMAICGALIAGGAAWQQGRAALEARNLVATLTAEVKRTKSVIQEQEKLLRQLREENGVYSRESAALREKMLARTSAPSVAQDAISSPSPSPSKPERGQYASKILDDPKMKKIFRQQRMLQLKQLYSDFVKERHLDSNQSGQFFDLLADGELREMQEGARLFNGDGQDASSTAMEDQALVAQITGSDQQMKTLLGDAGYASFKAYERTTGDRMVLAQVREQIGLAGSPINDDQAKNLLKIMTEERSRSQPTAFDPRGQGSIRDRFSPLLQAENGERYIEAQADLYRRILNRTAGVFTQEQYDALQRFQEQQLEMERMGVEMTREIMAHGVDGVSTSSTQVIEVERTP